MIGSDNYPSKRHYLYHVTAKENLEGILREGLKRKNGFCVYLCEDWKSWWKPGMIILRVRITQLGKQCEITTMLPELDEILVWGDIVPGRINRYHPHFSEIVRAKENYDATHVEENS